MVDDRAIEEMLEFIWAQREGGGDSIKELLCVNEVRRTGGDMDTLKEMERRELVIVGNESVSLTPEGERLAEGVVRRHRLAERLLADVLDVRDDEALETHACSFEHSLSASVADSICTLLGHPPSCPHGHPIPKGACCSKSPEKIKPLVHPLSETLAGETSSIVFIVPKTSKRLDRLGSFGLMPGCTVKLVQKSPTFVIQIGETTVAIDPDISKDIFVKRIN